MIFTLNKASDHNFSLLIEISSIKDLKEIAKQYDQELIINFEDSTIIVYDDYVE